MYNVCVCVANMERVVEAGRQETHSTQAHTRMAKKGTHGTATTRVGAASSREREADVILKVMRAGAGIPEVDD